MASDVLSVTGPLTFKQPDASSALLDEYRKRSGEVKTVDLSDVTEIDSSAILVLVRLQRRAEVNGVEIYFTNLPGRLRRLLDFYGLVDIIKHRQSGQSGQSD